MCWLELSIVAKEKYCLFHNLKTLLLMFHDWLSGFFCVCVNMYVLRHFNQMKDFLVGIDVCFKILNGNWIFLNSFSAYSKKICFLLNYYITWLFNIELTLYSQNTSNLVIIHFSYISGYSLLIFHLTFLHLYSWVRLDNTLPFS